MRNEELFAVKKSFHEQAAATRSRTAVGEDRVIEWTRGRPLKTR